MARIYGNAVAIDGGEIGLVNKIDGGEIGSFYPLLPETYTGATEVTPTQYTQVLNTNGKMVITNITVNPIPSNYGLVTWNGSVLTVS